MAISATVVWRDGAPLADSDRGVADLDTLYRVARELEASDQARVEWAWSILRTSMTRAARKMSADPDDQADLVQEALIRLWEVDPSRFDLRDSADVRYLKRLLRNRMWDVARAGALRIVQ